VGYYTGIFLNVLRKTTRIVSQNDWCLYQNSDLSSLEYRPGPLPFEPASSFRLTVWQGMSRYKGRYTRRHYGCGIALRSKDLVVKLSTHASVTVGSIYLSMYNISHCVERATLLRSCAVLLYCDENWAEQKETSRRWCGHSGAAQFKLFVQICLINKRYILECWFPAVVDRCNSLGCTARDSYFARIRLTVRLFDIITLPGSGNLSLNN